MLERIRERTGSAGLIVGVIALVLAVAGGAYAAGGGLSAKQKKEVEKIAKKSGKPGPQGQAGANGKDGVNGTNGAPGSNGAPGAPGKSVSVTAALPSQCSERGGAVVEEEGEPTSATEVCNGEEGSPWTAGGTLPSEATQTGSWNFIVDEGAGKEMFAVLSFPIPLAGGLQADKVHFEAEANFTDFDEAGPETVGCAGTTAVPKAPKENLCVYGAVNLENAKLIEIRNLANSTKAANRTGALLVFEGEAVGKAFGSGSFAVTGF